MTSKFALLAVIIALFIDLSVEYKLTRFSMSLSNNGISTSIVNNLPFKNMPVLVADTNSEEIVDFINLISEVLKLQVMEHTQVDGLNDLYNISNVIEVYPPDIFWHLDSTSASSPFNNNKRFLHMVSEDQMRKSEDEHMQSISKSDYHVLIPTLVSEDKNKSQHLAQSVANMIIQIMSAGSSDFYPIPRKNVDLNAGQWSHFISLTYPSIDEALPNLSELLIGIDAIELRVDLLADQSIPSIHRQINLLRSVTNLPIVFTVRSTGQIGKFPEDPQAMFTLLREGLRAGAEWIDIEACWPKEIILKLCEDAISQYSTTSCLLGSLHVTTPQTEEQITKLFQSASLYGYADILKVVTGAVNDDDCQRIHTIGQKLNKPYIGVCLGAQGSLSRVLNKRFTPVTHPLMATAAPGQLSVKQLMDQRLEKKLLISKKYYLFGTPIKQSLSPAMHNAAFKQLLMPYEYFLNEQESVVSYENLLGVTTTGTNTDNHDARVFGGASVTIPHKETVMKYIDELRSPVDSIDAVNTIEAIINTNNEKKLIGYNTDWLGIRNPILKKLSRTIGYPWSKELGERDKQIGLIIGAGGTAKAACYAIKDLGLSIVITNRDEEKGIQLAKKFNGVFMPLKDLATLVPLPIVVVSTVPFSANFTVPIELIHKWNEVKKRPVIMDVVYKPARTALLQQAVDNGYECVQGGSMLVEQGAQQFQIWHKRKAPYNVMKDAVFRDIETLDN